MARPTAGNGRVSHLRSLVLPVDDAAREISDVLPGGCQLEAIRPTPDGRWDVDLSRVGEDIEVVLSLSGASFEAARDLPQTGVLLDALAAAAPPDTSLAIAIRNLRGG